MPTTRKWFDLRTTKGWIEAAAALVAVLGGAIGLYLQVFPKEPDGNPVAAIAFNVPTNVQDSATSLDPSQRVTVDQTAIYTVEQHQQGLRAREQELREAAKPASGNSEEQQKAIERELQAVQAQLGNLENSHEKRVAELNRLTAELEALRGKVPDAEFQEASHAIKKALPTDHPALAAAYNSLAFVYRNQGGQNQAASLFKKAIAIDEQALPADDPALATDYGNLALLYHDQRRLTEAEALYKKVIAINEKALPANDPALATDYGNLALLYHDQRRLTEAEPLYKKAIAIDEKALPADHPALAAAYNNLAFVYRQQGRLKEAEPFVKKAVAIGEKVLPADNPKLASYYINLALLYGAQGRLDEAVPMYKKATSIEGKRSQSKP